MKALTDYPFDDTDDFKEVEVLSWDRDKYAKVRTSAGTIEEIKRGYLQPIDQTRSSEIYWYMLPTEVGSSRKTKREAHQELMKIRRCEKTSYDVNGKCFRSLKSALRYFNGVSKGFVTKIYQRKYSWSTYTLIRRDGKLYTVFANSKNRSEITKVHLKTLGLR